MLLLLLPALAGLWVLPASCASLLSAFSGVTGGGGATTKLLHLPEPADLVSGALKHVTDLFSSSPASLFELAVDLLPPMDDSVTSAKLAESFGFPAEGHYLRTEDGYDLRLDRIPNPGRQPVYIAHGILTGSALYMLLGKDKSLSLMLHNAGYDVWMVNFRGPGLSRNNSLSKKDDDSWRFSFHENGVFDNTAAIDYVLQQTGSSSVLYVGHSMGCSAFMAMAASRPEYQAKVRAAFLMGPVSGLHSHRSPLVSALYSVNNITEPAAGKLRVYHVIGPLLRFLRRVGKLLTGTVLRGLVYAFLSTIIGYNPNSAILDLPYFWETSPSRSSFGQIFHFLQNANPKTTGFRLYDHGETKNLQMYGSHIPPEYNLSSIKIPIFESLAPTDPLVTRQDLEYLNSKFQNVINIHFAQEIQFTHLDFLSSPTAPQQIYQPMIGHMQPYAQHITAK